MMIGIAPDPLVAGPWQACAFPYLHPSACILDYVSIC